MIKKINKYLLLIEIILVSNYIVAQKFNDFLFYCEIKPAPTSSYYKIKLDNKLLGKLNYNYNDLRVFRIEENDTIETPYLFNWLVNQTEYVEQPENLINVSYKANCCSFYTIRINESREINELVVNVQEKNFDKTLKLEGSEDGKNWNTIRENIRIVGFEAIDLKYTKINFSTSSYSFYRITLNDKNSKRITIDGAHTAFNKSINIKPNYLKDVYIVRKEIKKTERPEPKQVFVPESYSEIKITLPYVACINSISLSCRDTIIDYYRKIAIYDKKGKELYYGNFTSLSQNKITVCTFPEINETNFTIKIFNKDNEPLPGINAKIGGAEAHLLTKLDPEEKYFVTYSGRKSMQQGNYDLNYFSSKIEHTSKEIELLNEQTIKHEKPKKKEALVTQEKWLWITLIGLVSLLGFFAYSLMKKSG